MDPNWFYSSLAQSAAAIIGLLGAVLVSRLLQQLSVVRESKSILIQDYLKLRSSLHGTSRHLQDYVAFLIREIPEINKALEQGYSDREVSHEITFSGSRGSSESWRVPVSQEILSDRRRDLNLCQITIPALESTIAIVKLSDLDQALIRIRELEPRFPHEAKSTLGQHIPQLAGLADRCASYKAKLVPNSFIVMLVIIAWLSIASVIIPLGFLAARIEDNSKLLLISGFALGILGVLVYFGVLIKEVREAGKLEVPIREQLRPTH